MITCLEKPHSGREFTTLQKAKPRFVAAVAAPATAAGQSGPAEPVDPPRTFRLRRFLGGFSLSALGMALILTVGVSLMHVRAMGSEFAMPLVGLAVIIGVMCVGGGFGLMATSYSGFDEQEFDRLMQGEEPDLPAFLHPSQEDFPATDSDEAT